MGSKPVGANVSDSPQLRTQEAKCGWASGSLPSPPNSADPAIPSTCWRGPAQARPHRRSDLSAYQLREEMQLPMQMGEGSANEKGWAEAGPCSLEWPCLLGNEAPDCPAHSGLFLSYGKGLMTEERESTGVLCPSWSLLGDPGENKRVEAQV